MLLFFTMNLSADRFQASRSQANLFISKNDQPFFKSVSIQIFQSSFFLQRLLSVIPLIIFFCRQSRFKICSSHPNRKKIGFSFPNFSHIILVPQFYTKHPLAYLSVHNFPPSQNSRNLSSSLFTDPASESIKD